MTICLSALALLALARPGQTQPKLHVKPVNDSRCLARPAGGFNLGDCGGPSKTMADWQAGGGTIAFGDDCVAVRVDVQPGDGWISGTALQAVKCQDASVSAARKTWKLDGKLIKATNPPPGGPEKCLSINPQQRAVITDCREQLKVTSWVVTLVN